MKRKKKKIFLQRKKRYLKKIVGSSIKPRLSVFRSNIHIYAQLIDDMKGQTLASSSTLEKEKLSNLSKKDAAFQIGSQLAKRAINKEILSVVFDRGNYPYQGRIKSLAEGARQEGLIF